MRSLPVILALLVATTGACGLIHDDSTGDETMEQRSIEEVQEAHTAEWMKLDGVVGTGIGLCDNVPCIRVFLAHESEEARNAVPEMVEGYPVELVVTGPFRPRGIPDSTAGGSGSSGASGN